MNKRWVYLGWGDRKYGMADYDGQREADAHSFLILQTAIPPSHHRDLTESSLAVNMKRSTVPPNARIKLSQVSMLSGVIEGAHGVKVFTV
jgi:hypothetical protein